MSFATKEGASLFKESLDIRGNRFEFRLVGERVKFFSEMLLRSEGNDLIQVFAEFPREDFRRMLAEFLLTKKGEIKIVNEKNIMSCAIERDRDDEVQIFVSGRGGASTISMKDLPSRMVRALSADKPHDVQKILKEKVRNQLGDFSTETSLVIPEEGSHQCGFHILRRIKEFEEVVVISLWTHCGQCFIPGLTIDDDDYSDHQIDKWLTALRYIEAELPTGSSVRRYAMLSGFTLPELNNYSRESASMLASLRDRGFTVLDGR